MPCRNVCCCRQDVCSLRCWQGSQCTPAPFRHILSILQCCSVQLVLCQRVRLSVHSWTALTSFCVITLPTVGHCRIYCSLVAHCGISCSLTIGVSWCYQHCCQPCLYLHCVPYHLSCLFTSPDSAIILENELRVGRSCTLQNRLHSQYMTPMHSRAVCALTLRYPC